MRSGLETRADAAVRPIRVVREIEVLRIRRPTDVLDDDAFDEHRDLITASATL
jgi:hypothetical protein